MKPQIEIKNPCQENWDAMKPNNNGRFCLVCQESVIDLTNKKPDEIALILKTNSNKKICGRFNTLDVKSNNCIGNLLWKLNIKGFRYLAIMLFSLLLITGCRTRKATYGKIRTTHKKHKTMVRVITTPTF